MKYGLIGKKLKHSYSKIIHEKLGYYNYDLIELNDDELETFLKKKDFNGINVTVPYKQKVIPYLNALSKEAIMCNSVNTIVNENGNLVGYNTDFLGFNDLLKYNNIDVYNKKIMVLGTGGSAQSISNLLNSLSVKQIIFVSSSNKKGSISYQDIDKYCYDIDILINTTPKEMFPNNEQIIVSIDNFDNLSCVIDIIYNPLNTNLLLQAKQKGIKAINGLYMLVSQALYSAEYFLNNHCTNNHTKNKIYEELVNEKENIVLIGMPSCGKSTIGKKLAKKLNKEFYDIDNLIANKINMNICDYINKYGEEEFRKIEHEVIKQIYKQNSLVIATGGGTILNEKNVLLLKQNSKLFFIDRDIQNLHFDVTRPLSSTYEKLVELYIQRYDLYNKYCDYKIDGNQSICKIINTIVRRRNK